MRVLVSEPLPSELEELLERRRRMGVDRSDEVWEGVLHMAPAPSHGHGRIGGDLAYLLRPYADRTRLFLTTEITIGDSHEDYRVPDLALHRSDEETMCHPTAALVVEIRSPGDETYEKLPFYAAHHVDEVLIVDPDVRTVRWLALQDGEYRPASVSSLLDVGAEELAGQLAWPA